MLVPGAPEENTMRNTVCTLALTALLAAGLTCSAAAQDDASTNAQATAPTTMSHHHEMNADRDLARMTKHLSLTQDQQTQIKPILENRDQQLNQLYQDSSMSKADRRSKSKDIRDDAKSKIDPILNDEQKAKFDSMGSRHHHSHHGQQSTAGTEGTSPQ